ncbi:hypothetical protein QYF36_018059 [Acer negundo]|nr:hypothetical protein QYF36_018059 [Acer negundo]
MKSRAEVKPKPVEPAISIAKLDIRVCKSIKAHKYPDVDSLYVEEIDMGEGQSRTVVSVFIKFMEQIAYNVAFESILQVHVHMKTTKAMCYFRVLFAHCYLDCGTAIRNDDTIRRTSYCLFQLL